MPKISEAMESERLPISGPTPPRPAHGPGGVGAQPRWHSGRMADADQPSPRRRSAAAASCRWAHRPVRCDSAVASSGWQGLRRSAKRRATLASRPSWISWGHAGEGGAMLQGAIQSVVTATGDRTQAWRPARRLASGVWHLLVRRRWQIGRSYQLPLLRLEAGAAVRTAGKWRPSLKN